jgi:hypothetical protein
VLSGQCLAEQIKNKSLPYGGLLFLLLLCKNQPFVIIMTNELWDNNDRFIA